MADQKRNIGAADAAPGTDSTKQGSLMKTISHFLRGVLRDESGGEVLEYALIVGLIVVAAITVITSVGTKVLARWTSLNARM